LVNFLLAKPVVILRCNMSLCLAGDLLDLHLLRLLFFLACCLFYFSSHS